MARVHHLASEIGIVGWSCRLPGAPDVDAFWQLLRDGRCAVTQIPADRWSLERFGHPQRQTRGRSYTWAAGVVDNVWDFDPAMFGISPREAEQLDPQQRLLLELTWEALEDAGIKPSAIAGTEVGVFVGGSSTDYANFRTGDPACADSHFATGNALSVLANRLSYVFDLKGPSLTIDTACSSSLVALHHATEALRTRRIEMAIVAGVNVLASPFSFISFSQASMLSPTGRSRAFSADADGYVRAEGGVALVLRRANLAELADQRAHGLIVASDVNSDGRTNGIALPSSEAQERLIRKVYSAAGINPDQLAFVEAHGTGTPAGDPIEAGAIGRALGRQRQTPLPVGSVKTNIGHLEPAAGLAGLLKAMLALKHGVLPSSLHFSSPNPTIPFGDLNLEVAAKPIDLSSVSGKARYAGVNSFGFGGTNAHAIIAPITVPVGQTLKPPQRKMAPLLITAKSSRALSLLAGRYANAIAGKNDHAADMIARAAAHHRERLAHRLVVTAESANEMSETLAAWSRGSKPGNAIAGTGAEGALPVAFVYSGNGSQWVGMGRHAYRRYDDFRSKFDAVDQHFMKLSGWSLAEAMLSDDLAARLPRTSVAQPLIFAIQVAATRALRNTGIKPMAVLGHSVGEVAAAFAAGALDLETAVRVIHFRSLRQELAAGSGDMIVVGTSAEAAGELANGIEGLEIAAINSMRAVTLSGPVEALDEVKRRASAQGVSVVPLSLGYPFHSALMAPCYAPLMTDLKAMQPCTESVPFVSTVTGGVLQGPQLDADYWWRNVRAPVLFSAAVKAAADLGARFFLEIGPRGTLLRHIKSCLDGREGTYVSLSLFDRSEERASADPIGDVVAQALVAGATISEDALFGRESASRVELPLYAWDRRTYRFEPSSEAVGYRVGSWHPLIGDRHVAGGLEWHSTLDTTMAPHLADHVVAGSAILPGSAFLEMALAAARQWLEATHVVVRELEIQKPMNLSASESREVMVRISPGSSTFEISSRPRLTGAAWLLHARGKIFAGTPSDEERRSETQARPLSVIHGDALYALARSSGLNYGPAFRLVDRVVRVTESDIEVALTGGGGEQAYLLDPMLMDACFHGLFVLFPELGSTSRGVAYIPVRIEETTFHAVGSAPVSAAIKIRRVGPRSILADFRIYAENGELIAKLSGARFVAVVARRRPILDNLAVVERLQTPADAPRTRALVDLDPKGVVASITADREGEASEDALILEGWATAAVYEIASGLAENGVIDLNDLVRAGRVPAALTGWLTSVFVGLKSAGLMDGGPDQFRVLPDPLLPASTDVIGALTASHASRAPELLLAGTFSVIAKAVATERKISEGALDRLTHSALEFYRVASRDARVAEDLLLRILTEGLGTANGAAPVRPLIIGGGKLSDFWRTASGPTRAAVTVLDHEAQRSGGDIVGTAAELPEKTFDIAVSAGGLARLDDAGLAAVCRAMAPGGLMIAMEPPPSLFRDLVFGLYQATSRGAGGPTAMVRTPSRWSALLSAAGFESAAAAAVDAAAGWSIVSARAPDALISGTREAGAGEPSESSLPGLAAPVIVASDLAKPHKLIDALKQALKADVAVFDAVADRLDVDEHPRTLIVVPSEASSADDPRVVIAERCLMLAKLAGQLQQAGAKSRVWVIHRDALAAPQAGMVDPIETASWTYCRTLQNEYPSIDFRRVDLARRLPIAAAVAQLTRLMRSDTAETELQIGREGVRVVRIEAFEPAAGAQSGTAAAARLARGAGPGQRLVWEAAARPAPAAGEVEIAVEATGLNFRDLMWSMDLLPDDMLEDGFTGPTLGLECAGKITRVGAGVTRVSIGDRVVAMAPQSFSSHVVTKEQMLAKIPDQMPAEAAATIPVAFLTAYYSLVTLANLEKGESVLIHGAAGAVGLAAIQIARERGATIIATAGSRPKRDMLRAMGVAHVLDSRTTAFAEKVREITDGGVDVVLNSLAGEPMERSVHALRPFGRFVELGKRDYVANTHLGLRPFRRNLSYFGVDVDQLIAGNRNAGQRVFTNVMRLVRDGVLTPLPYSVFDGESVADAFDLMQHSGHIGKIVVRPPDLSRVPASLEQPAIAHNRTHLITGAFGGFGMETARWLVARGARNLVLLGRQGAASEAARALVAELKGKGVKVLAAQCDVANAAALEGLLKTVKATMPPLGGVIHAAMVLEDGLIANLDTSQLERVLAPKVTGAANLDRLTREYTLDYFVLFSSITTVIGNPGQASYVAANGYLEGIARRRRQDGLAGLAIAWGPILDVGVVAREEKLRKALMDRRGLSGLQVAEALDLFGDALARAKQDPSLSVITISPRDWAKQATALPALRSPTYSRIVRTEAEGEEPEVETINLRELIATEEPEAARRKIIAVITSRLGAVLHMRAEDIDQARPFATMGVDSLMTFEFASSLEKAFEMPIALTASFATLCVSNLADQIMAQAGRDRPAGSAATSIAEKHMTSASAKEVAILKEVAASQDLRHKRLLQ